MVKNPPAKQKGWVWSLGQEDPLEKEMATHYSILAWEIPRVEEPGRLQSMHCKRDEDNLPTKQQKSQIKSENTTRKLISESVFHISYDMKKYLINNIKYIYSG